MCLQGGTCLRRKPAEVSSYITWTQEEVPSSCKVLLLAHNSCQTALECATMVGGKDLHTVSGCCPAVLNPCFPGMQGWTPRVSVSFRCGSQLARLSARHMASLCHALAVPEACPSQQLCKQ